MHESNLHRKKEIRLISSIFIKCAYMLRFVLNQIKVKSGTKILIAKPNAENMCTRPKCVLRELIKERL